MPKNHRHVPHDSDTMQTVCEDCGQEVDLREPMAILQSTSTHPNHDALLNRALLKVGKNAKCDFTAAIAALAESSGKHDETW